MKKLTILPALAVSLLSISWLSAIFGPSAPKNLTVGEFFENPLGYSLEALSFSWQLPEGDGMRQSAYEIVVADSPSMSEESVVWTSGKVESSRNVKIYYPNEVPARTKLYWKVRFWDGGGDRSSWSAVNTFESGINTDDWRAFWLSSPEEPIPADKKFLVMGKEKTLKNRNVPPSYFRKEINLKKDVKKARLYFTCRGIAKAHVNGSRIGDDYWSTGWTEYTKRVPSNTYDITANLKKGANAVGVELADGWYCGTQAWCYVVRAGNPPLARYKPDFMLQIEVVYADGTTETFVSDASWKFSYGARIAADIYNGEKYDSRLEFGDWTSAGFNDFSWKSAAAERRTPDPFIEPRRCQPIRCTDIFKPVSIRKTGDGVFIVDFGQNFAGIPRLNFPALKSGTSIKIRCAEILDKDGSFYTENYSTAESTDIYISNGKPFVWEPIFTYHGFRYLEVSGLPAGFKLAPENIAGLALRTDAKMAGSFECSDPLVNKLQSNIQWGQRSNFFSTPTDCPQRAERMGFTGDCQVFMPTALFNMNLDAFFIKWTTDLMDAQSKDGVYPYYAPNLPKYTPPTPGWSDCGVIAPWEAYLFYGDKKILHRNYDGMVKWVLFQKKASTNLIAPDRGIGDWLQPNPRPKSKMHGKRYAPDAPNDLIGTAYFARTATIVAKTAEVLGRKSDAAKFAKLADDVRAAYLKRFVHSDGTVVSDCQTAYLMTLSNDIIKDENLRKKCFGKFVARIAADNYKLNTGFLGTPLLNPTLSRFGRNDLAFRLLMNKTSPSWLYAVANGATTIWETWDGERDMSFNHYAYGAIGQWLYKEIGGLWYDESAAGFKNIVYAPKLDGVSLDYAKTAHETPNGRAESSWRKTSDGLEWKIVVPPNSTATVILPCADISKATFDGEKVAAAKLEKVQSGTHTVKISNK